MADASYDLVLIGGGSKTLPVAMYAAKYGGPGFLSELHSSTVWRDLYFAPLWEDFPDFEEKGARLARYPG